MSDEITTSIRINKVKKRQYIEFGKEQGYNTLSKLINYSIDACMRNPSLLQPTEDTQSKKILESLEQSFSVFDDLGKVLVQYETRLDSLDFLLEAVALKVGMSKTEIKEAQKKDVSGEAVFEE